MKTSEARKTTKKASLDRTRMAFRSSLSLPYFLGIVLLVMKKHTGVALITSHNSLITIQPLTQLKSFAEAKEDDFRINTVLPQTSPPLTPHSFSGQVESSVIDKFGTEETHRVIDSWRLVDEEYEHRQFVGDENDDVTTSYNYQYAHSFVPGLRCQNFWDVSKVQWSKKLTKGYKTIRNEFFSVMGDMNNLQKEGNNIWAGALTKEANSYGDGWKTLVLMNRGIWDEVNCNVFPKTAKCVKDSGIPATEVFFASMKPHSSIKMHSDFTNFVLTSHLAVDIPESGNNKCRLAVGDDTRQWTNGSMMLFDTSIMHNAVNESDGIRYILMFRLWHPDLTLIERAALQHIYDCLELPELLSTDQDERIKAEERINKLRSFPKLKLTGFGGGANSLKSGKKKKKRKR